MTDQRPLFHPPAPTGRLTDRQLAAYEYVRDRPGGVSPDEVGALLHGIRRSHHPDTRCEWCGADGNSVLAALRSEKNGRLVTRRRVDGLWVLRDEQAAESDSAAETEGYDPTTARIPF